MPLPTVTILRILFYLSLAIWSTNAQGVTTTAISTINPSTTKTSASPTLASTTSLGSPVPTTAPDLGDCISNCTVSSADENSAAAQYDGSPMRVQHAHPPHSARQLRADDLPRPASVTIWRVRRTEFNARADSSQFKDPSDVVPSLGAPTSAPPNVSAVPDPAPSIVVGGDSDGNNTGFGSAGADGKRPMGSDAGGAHRVHSTGVRTPTFSVYPLVRNPCAKPTIRAQGPQSVRKVISLVRKVLSLVRKPFSLVHKILSLVYNI
ncbi:hypothetical protein EXIGLDRAFT_698989 [Exidia glandulosa HHB12029]|uniref:Uncharacterized protein n=1 Tax=Exidia glandulosa HHB12029 TaxID=1314781 RepID=A0A165ZV06_EXIGL|nr:hypothetical protein EXIGLDRAFT_698989 [Exidia glandulosa HHB12029]